MKKDFKYIIGIGSVLVLIIILLSGGTFAYYSWRTDDSQKTEVVFTVKDEFRCAADGGGNITQADVDIAPASCTNSQHAIKREVKVMPTITGGHTVLMNLWLDINELGTGLSNSVNFKYALTTESDSCTDGVVFAGNFYGKQAGDTVTILNNTGYTTTTVETYYLYIWLDSNETSKDTMLQDFDLSINGMCTNAPEPQTYVAFNSTDGSLRLSKKSVDEVSNGNRTPYVSSLNNKKVETVSDVTTIDDDSVLFDLEKTNYSSEEQLPWYSYRDQITKIIIEDEISPISTAYWFKDLSNVTYVDLSKLNTSRVTNMTHMFSGMSSLTYLDLSRFNTSKVTRVEEMFSGMSSLTSLDLSSFDTSKITYMYGMFRDCVGLIELDLSNFDTRNVTSMHSMFYGCASLKHIYLSNFDTAKVTDMEAMFYSCNSLVELDLSNFNTSKVTSMKRMFQDLSSLDSLEVSSLNTSNVKDMYSMFSGCNKLTSLDLSSFDISKVTTMEKMFRNCKKLTSLNLSNANFSNVTTYTDMFLNMPSNANITVKDSTQKSWINNNFTNLTNVIVKS